MLHRSFLPAVLSLFPAVASAQQLVAIDSSRSIWIVDASTGARAQIGTATSNASTSAGLAYDLGTDTIYLTSTGNDSLYTLDLATGTATLVGAYGNSAMVMHGLEVDISTGALYGLSQHDNGLYSIDKATGVATLIGTTGLTSFTNLAYDATTATMFATNSGTDSFYRIDLATGAATLIGALGGPTNPNGLAVHLPSGVLYCVDNSTDRLYTIDKVTGVATEVGSTGTGNLLGLVYLPNIGDVSRTRHACGPTTITSLGLAKLGGSVVTTLGGVTGVPFVGYGLQIVAFPFCTCTVGHDWSVPLFGASHTFALPTDPVFSGLRIGVQGADLLGTGGCAAPQITFTDTMVITIG